MNPFVSVRECLNCCEMQEDGCVAMVVEAEEVQKEIMCTTDPISIISRLAASPATVDNISPAGNCLLRSGRNASQPLYETTV